ncbi:MAG: DUF86 domain-containing protein [Candidatus Parvarchaeota archaeon]|jgi:uncharacterized protein with HEPN domain|nr:DUF86 domain-containing protein [Candidatus Parvarchaeota archaeon]
MIKDQLVLIHDLIDAINKIEAYTRDMSEEQFLKDVKTQDAVIRRLEIIGEATKNISSDYKEKHSGLPWRTLAGLRDILIHKYFDVRAKAIWEMLKVDLPELKDKLGALPKK